MNTAGASSTGVSASADTSEEEEDSSSSSHPSQTIEYELDSFREKWKQELAITKQHDVIAPEETEQANDVESMAKILFQNGIEMELSGKLYEAIQFYRRAVQLVPDIEFRYHAKLKNKHTEVRIDSEEVNMQNDDHHESDNSDDEDSDDEIATNLFAHIQKKSNRNPSICSSEKEQTITHFSALPMEIMLYILRWIISSDLDVRSLEMCSQVCRGFYICCRDTEIWRSICARTWNLNLGKSPIGFISWREMFINRPRLLFHGCYISKTTYIRHGEHSFQDQFYRPWHIVTYYRYLRFFPDGLVLMLTTADEPTQCVGQLKYQNSKSPAILSGHYRLKDDKIFLVVQHDDNAKITSVHKRHRKKDIIQDSLNQSFHLEMQIKNHKNQKHIQLVWTGYSVYTHYKNGSETSCAFELIGNRFPPLWFSRVKSYTAEAYSPLE